MIETRLGAGILSLARKDDNLLVRGNPHAETILGYGAQTLAARCGADLAFETHPLTLQLNLLCIERGESFGLLNANRASPHDCERDEQETREEQSYEVATAHIRRRGGTRGGARFASAN